MTNVVFVQTAVPGATGSLPLGVSYKGNNGQTPIIESLAVAPFSEVPVAPIVRVQPFVALTPNEVELNRELAYLANNPIVTS